MPEYEQSEYIRYLMFSHRFAERPFRTEGRNLQAGGFSYFPYLHAARNVQFYVDYGTSYNSMSTHRLAAIMFTDIVGYTAMMQRDEAEGVASFKRPAKRCRPK